jgi:hypothetical protein
LEFICIFIKISLPQNFTQLHLCPDISELELSSESSWTVTVVTALVKEGHTSAGLLHHSAT